MPSLDGRDLQILKGGGGEKFTAFVDRLIRGEAHTGGLAQSEIVTQVRANVQDGGVDTEVRSAVPRDKSGFLEVPTCWQFKAESAEELRKRKTKEEPYRFLTVEVNKHYVQQTVQRGYGFRFCFLGDLPPEDVAEWEEHLLIECRKINSSATKPRVITTASLAAWADRFPAIASLIKPFTADIFNLDGWQRNIREVTPKYVVFPGWQSISAKIVEHTTIARVIDPCFSVQGEAGVGKTRLVCEVLSGLESSASLVMYTRDEEVAYKLSVQLANDSASTHAIVVADECSLQKRLQIEANVKGCRHRVRFICLSNQGERAPSGASEIWLEELPQDLVEQVLSQNFPSVPRERRTAYAELAGGFIRFSADMCEHDAQIAPGNLGPVLTKIMDYVTFRARDVDERRVVECLSLFTRIGAKADVAEELASVCKIIGMQAKQVLEISNRMKDSPGFIAIAGRYLYVTPAIVAQVAFERGWKMWVQDDPQAFIQNLAPTLLPAFLNRCKEIGTEEVKALMGTTFRSWILNRRHQDLSDPEQMERFAVFVETDPDEYLPLLRDLVVSSPSETLRTARGYGRSARREIVWVAEKLAAFPELYSDCESILFRLAVEESEPNIGNNATHIWRQLQRVALSGTSVPFKVRFDTLKNRLTENTGPIFELCMTGVHSIFASNVMRMGVPATIGGRLRPTDWHPVDNKEFFECWRTVLDFLVDLVQGQDDEKGVAAVKVTVDNLFAILNAGLLNESRSILSGTNRSGSFLEEIIEKLEEFITRTEEAERDKPKRDEAVWTAYLSAAHAWLEEISPDSLEGRVRTLVSRNPWHKSLREIQGNVNPNLASIASEIYLTDGALEKLMPFLTSDNAKAAILLGSELGQIDSSSKLAPTIFKWIERGGGIAFARGYLFTSVQKIGSIPASAEAAIQRLSQTNPLSALELLLAAGCTHAAITFALSAVDGGNLPLNVLTRFPYNQQLSESLVKELLLRFVRGIDINVNSSFGPAIQFLTAVRYTDQQLNPPRNLFRDDSVREMIWKILERAPKDDGYKEDYDRAEVVSAIAELDVERAVNYLIHTIIEKGYGSTHDHMLKVLVDLIPRHSELIMNRFGSAMLDAKAGFALSLGGTATCIIQALQHGVVIDWVRRHGLQAARIFARELPLPYSDKESKPIVPEVTLQLLNEFGKDGETFDAFVRGGTRGDSWWGNGGDYFRSKAMTAKQFLSHPNHCIRKWAQLEMESSERLAESEQLRFDERRLS